MRVFSFLISFITVSVFGDLIPFLKSDFGFAAKNTSIQNIDAIYVINLDKRPQKYQKTLAQIEPYNIVPYRFSAIDGLQLSLEAVNQLGVIFQKDMLHGEYVQHYYVDGKSRFPHGELLDKEFYGKCCFSPWNYTVGSLGCYLSFLSILKNALDCQYQAIWVMEDDVSIQNDPHLLGEYIDKLDRLIGKNNWDVLYTDIDDPQIPLNNQGNNRIYHKKGIWPMWRPDIPAYLNEEYLGERKVLSDDFVSIKYRNRAHSLIFRRSGIEKILQFANEHHIFYPWDAELSWVPNLKVVCLRKNITSYFAEISDTQSLKYNPGYQWGIFKKEIVKKSEEQFNGGNASLQLKILDFVNKIHPVKCCEVGPNNGETTFSIVKALEFLGLGTLELFNPEPANSLLDQKKDSGFKEYWEKRFNACEMDLDFVKIGKNMGQEGYDFIFLNLDDDADLSTFLGKVKKGKYLCVYRGNESERESKINSLVKNWEWLEKDSEGKRCMFFRKPF